MATRATPSRRALLLIGCLALAACLVLSRLVDQSGDVTKPGARHPQVLRQNRAVDPVELVDYQNYSFTRLEATREGPGEHGRPVPMSRRDRELRGAAYARHGFNSRASEHVGLHRALPDLRHPRCVGARYPADLPTASVVIATHNEHVATLLRTVTSVLSRSPAQLLLEVIVVDDSSDHDRDSAPLPPLAVLLEEAEEAGGGQGGPPPRLRLLRLPRRVGPIQARAVGARAALGEALVFLDSHCEVNTNWLPPLLERLWLRADTVACPLLDVIDHSTFTYRAQEGGARRGAFDWRLDYKRLPLLPGQLPYLPFRTPVGGGIFAIRRDYLQDLGGLEDGLEMMGGESLQLSLKVWMCGGQVEEVPCSRVGHVYKKSSAYTLPSGAHTHGSVVLRNLRHVTDTWLGEHRAAVFRARPELLHLQDAGGDVTGGEDVAGDVAGDVTGAAAASPATSPAARDGGGGRVGGRECRSSAWFLREVAPDILRHFPLHEPPPVARGKVRNLALRMCLSARADLRSLEMRRCKLGLPGQNLTLSWRGELRVGGACMDAVAAGRDARLLPCHGERGNQHWEMVPLLPQRKSPPSLLLHAVTRSCLEARAASSQPALSLRPCDPAVANQQWVL
uniref:Polypeptide N-acetylgalactosaminyltransferase n=1 Tax=Petromyzon marinus TaxID=7757 RepID=A0AAJ7UKE5_PETMA|nr:polypeptide N-acetylgalactosaminyltransferase 10-like [Petromyzon marinus]